jgi:GNAT superfamily N-acetyltransferase
VAVRPATAADVPQLAALCREHAHFEGAAIAQDLEPRLHEMLFSGASCLSAWVVPDQHGGTIHGYATASCEASTWRGARFLHLDCLYLSPQCRGQGLGRRLLDAVRQHAAAQGIGWLEWQTPAWNENAIRFYQHYGASALPKLRFSLDAL